jgi:hypothetical protein
METDVLLTPPPDSVDGVFVDRYFLQHLHAEIEGIKFQKKVALPKGQKLKRNPYDTLQEKKYLHIEIIVEEYRKIAQKASKLPSGCRNALSYMVAKSTRSMYNTYKKINCMT